MSIIAKCGQESTGTNYYAVIIRDATEPIGTVIYDPVRNQFCFHPGSLDLVLSMTDAATIFKMLNVYKA